MFVFFLQIPPDDGYSTSICGTCWSITENFHRLYETVQLAEANLSNYECQVDSPAEMDTIDNYTEYHQPVDDDFVSHDVKPSMDDENIVEEVVIINHQQQQLIEFKEEVVKEEEMIDEEEVIATSSSTKSSPRMKIAISQEDIQRRRERIDDENQQIRDFFRMNCELCDLTFNTMKEATMHYRKQHKQAGYLVCCEKKFFRRCLALDHINHHISSSPLQ